jgi:hypothetical protein
VTLARRAPYVVVLGLAGGLLGLHTYDAVAAGEWVEVWLAGVVAAAALVHAVFLGLRGGPRPWTVPEWARRFEVEGAALTVRCNHCDTDVLPPVFTAALPRLLTYAHVHTTTACQRNRQTQDGPTTARLRPARVRRARDR